MQKVSVLLPNLFSVCTYFAKQALPAGTFVRVPFGRTELNAVVWDTPIDTNFPDEKIKPILQVLDTILPLDKNIRAFVDWVADYTLSPAGLILKMVLPIDVCAISKKPAEFPLPILSKGTMQFSAEQQQAIDHILPKITDRFSVTLIDGVTGSGKTAVYFEAIFKALQQNRQVLVLLPEITLTTAWLNRFEKRFGVKPAVWHSAMTLKQRRDTWHAIQDGTAKVLVGARSALFLPFKTLGLIIVDEEHDASYKQEDGVLYQARDMAVVRGQIEKLPVLLASATPSLETFCNVLNGRFDKVVLTHRYAGACLPDIELVDMRTKNKDEKGFISTPLKNALAENLKAGNQSLLFLNRRGYAPMRLCRACGEKIKCPHCSVFLTEHKALNKMVCHQCGYTRALTNACPACGEKDSLISCGCGVERIYHEISELFPEARTQMVTSDTMTSPKAFDELCENLDNHKLDILIGTQMLAKGHNFPDLTLVGIVDADFGLAGGDLRASERTFQLLQQVAGRAGRHDKKGRALLQTYSPQNNVIQALLTGDRPLFMESEIAARQMLSMPPFGRLAALIISGKDELMTLKVAKSLIRHAPIFQGVEFLGPVAAPIFQLRGKYRYRILVKSQKQIALNRILKDWLAHFTPPLAVTIRVDIDPYTFL